MLGEQPQAGADTRILLSGCNRMGRNRFASWNLQLGRTISDSKQGDEVAESRPFEKRKAACRGFRGGPRAVSSGRRSGEEKGASGRRQLRSSLDLHSGGRRSE